LFRTKQEHYSPGIGFGATGIVIRVAIGIAIAIHGPAIFDGFAVQQGLALAHAGIASTWILRC
jgi:hypothetical protein